MRNAALADGLANATRAQQIKFAEMVREVYVAQVVTTQRVLEPARLRQMDEDIATLKSQR